MGSPEVADLMGLEGARSPDLKLRLRLVAPDIMGFLGDRLKVQLREQGARHDLVDAVLALQDEARLDDLFVVVRRVDALGKFLDTVDGKQLLAGYRRATNLLRDEEKKRSRDVYWSDCPRSIKRTRGTRA